MLRLDKAEMEPLVSYENDKWGTSMGRQAALATYGEYARRTFRTDKRLNIRLSTKDLEELQEKALAEELPYQTLIVSISHKYVAGRLMKNPDGGLRLSILPVPRPLSSLITPP